MNKRHSIAALTIALGTLATGSAFAQSPTYYAPPARAGVATTVVVRPAVRPAIVVAPPAAPVRVVIAQPAAPPAAQPVLVRPAAPPYVILRHGEPAGMFASQVRAHVANTRRELRMGVAFHRVHATALN